VNGPSFMARFHGLIAEMILAFRTLDCPSDNQMSQEKSIKGISRTVFLTGIVAAVIVSTLLSSVIAIQWAKGPKGDPGSNGETGLQGIQGPVGPQGPGAMFASAQGLSAIETDSSTSWVDLDDMSVSISPNRTSYILILFSAEAMSPNGRISIRALVGSDAANPDTVFLTSKGETAAFTSDYFAAYTYSFFKPSVGSGTYTVKLQWKVTLNCYGHIVRRTLNVIALPLS